MKKILILCLLFALVLISACSSQKDGEQVSFQDQVNEEFGTDVYIPQLDDYPIKSAVIQKIPVGDDKDLIIQYSKEKGKLKDDEFIKKYENNMNAEVLYGIYEGEPLVFKMTYNDKKGDSQPGESKTINGIDVQYHKIERNNSKTLLVSFNVNEGTYLNQFNLKEITEDKAFDVIDTITSKVIK